MRALPGEHVEFLIKQTKYAIYFGFCKPVENLPREFLGSDDSTVTSAVLVKGEGFDGTPIAADFTATADIGIGGELSLKLTSRSTCREFAGENVKYVINVGFNYANSVNVTKKYSTTLSSNQSIKKIMCLNCYPASESTI